MTEIMDFGDVALAGAFLKPEHFAEERRYPLRLYFCDDCYAVQIVDKIDPGVLFKDYFYFSSAIRTLREHFRSYAAEVTTRFLDPPRASVLEFGCNDGVLLKPFADQGVRTVIGVDPATNIVKTIDDPRITVVNDFFNEAVAAKIVERHGKVDLVAANNVYAHIPDIQGMTRAIRDVLSDDGVFVFEVHYLGKIVKDLQYDMIYHEHLYYYSLLALKKHFERYGMLVFDVKPVEIHAGSMRYYVCKQGSRHSLAVTPEVRALEAEEIEQGYDRAGTYARFAQRVDERRAELMALLEELRAQGSTIAGYGASGRANTMIQYCGIDGRHLEYMIDDAPAKAGFYTPGSHFPIYSGEVLKQGRPPDYLLLFAWSFLSEIMHKNVDYLDNGGRMIVPLPNVRIVTHPDAAAAAGASEPIHTEAKRK